MKACDEILAGKLHDHFVVDMMQGGAGTSTNMNANEVIANRGLELMGHAKGEYKYLHPNDHVNCSQSTNDAYPTAIKLAVIFSLKDTLAAMGELRRRWRRRRQEFAHVLKMGRTENQDAVPMTLGQEFGAYAVMIDTAMAALNAIGRGIARAQHGRHRDRHRHQQPAGLRRPGDAAPRRDHRTAAEEGDEPRRSDAGFRRVRADGRRR